MSRRVLELARCPIECPIRSQFGLSENKKIPPECGIANGETRTRTGDTTIFSRYVLAVERREIPGNDRFLRVGFAPLIFAVCAGFHAFQGMAGLPSPFSAARFAQA
jgi:hypothetical protein